MTGRLIACLLLLLTSASGHAAAAERVALVLGNGAYRHTVPLPNPPRDARAMAAALRRLGFAVIEGIDLDRRATAGLLAEFATVAEGAEVALFFYAGHGLEVAGRNHLVPVDAELKSGFDLPAETVGLDLVLEAVEATADTGLVFLDACRDNPLARRLRGAGGTSRSPGVGRGLARLDAPAGLFVAYATRPGDTAGDGQGGHSPFTGALLGHIETPGLELHQLMNRVRQAVLSETGNRQQPWDESSLTLDFYFVPPLAQRPPVADTGPGDARVEVAFWESVHGGSDPRLFEEYLRQYPDGRFAALARLKLDALRGGSAPATGGATAARTEGGAPGPTAPTTTATPAPIPPARPPQVVTSSPPTVVRPGASGPAALPGWGAGPPGGARFESVPLGF